jgi:Ser/Thr protein kinase RdoA (MazF antagonist)
LRRKHSIHWYKTGIFSLIKRNRDICGYSRGDLGDLAREPLRAVGRWLSRAGDDADAVRESARRFAGLAGLVDELAAIIAPAARATPTPPGAGALPVGLCHGDLQLENVRFDGDRPTLFDLEACGVGPCADDLASYWRQRIGLAPDGAALPAAPGATWGQDWLLDPEYLDAHLAMIERLATAARAAITQP